MPVTSKQSRASGSPVAPLRKSPDERWVKAKEVAAFLGLSLGAIYRSEAGTGAVRSAYLPGTGNMKRGTRRFFWPDVLKIHAQMLRESEPKQEAIPARILQLMGRGRKRR